MGLETTLRTWLSPLLAPLAGPAGGAGWETGLPAEAPANPWGESALTLSPGARRAGELPAGPLADAETSRRALSSLFAAGVARDLAGAAQATMLERHLSSLDAGQLASVTELVARAETQAGQVFLLKAFTAGEPWENLEAYAAEMRGLSEEEVISRSTIRDAQDLIQQWQDACGPTLVQAALAEADPRYAWELNKAQDLSAVDPAGGNRALAEQQRQWLAWYGGAAVPRGETGGAGIALNTILNQVLAPLTGARYLTQPVTDVGAAVTAIATTLEAGFDVPLRLSWDAAGESGHFVLAMASEGGPGDRWFQIHDPWTGRTDWVHEQSLLTDAFDPIFSGFARLTHYYAATTAA